MSKLFGRRRSDHKSVPSDVEIDPNACFYHAATLPHQKCPHCGQAVCDLCLDSDAEDARCDTCWRLDDALDAAGAPTSVQPNVAHYTLGSVAQRAEDWDLAHLHLKIGARLSHAIQDADTLGRCLNGIGQVYVSQQQFDQAVPYHQACVAQCPDYHTGREALAIAYWATGQLDDARKELKKLQADEFEPNRMLMEQLGM
jgi:uncharacterized protein HemY